MTSSYLVKVASLITLSLSFFVGHLSAQADSPKAAAVKTAMAEMISEAAKLGEPKLDGSSLYFGTTKINGNYALVDALKAKHQCTSTFFAKKGESFIRISTNVIKDDGSRAVGTQLDPKGPAIAAIQKNEAYYGVADILGKKYQTGYEPVRNAAQEIIGVYYIGFLLE
ncbi:MAG: hypothetical protein RL376_1547 [Verrucomicrobiota bacterium]|jgi:hypothetical protein